jgi:hypothetical protein
MLLLILYAFASIFHPTTARCSLFPAGRVSPQLVTNRKAPTTEPMTRGEARQAIGETSAGRIHREDLHPPRGVEETTRYRILSGD